MKKLLLLLLAFGCSETPISPDKPEPTKPTPPPAKPDPVGVTVGDGTDSDLLPPPVLPEDPYRERRRMDLDQLDATIQTVTGGLEWTEGGNNQFVALAPTLGKPDFLTITSEDLEPSAMFQKFLDDAARNVCFELVNVDQNRTAEERTFFVDAEVTDSFGEQPARVTANLQQLLLRFHGRKLAADAPELEPWTWLMRSAEHVSNDQAEVWRTVCVGLMTHPDFYTY